MNNLTKKQELLENFPLMELDPHETATFLFYSPMRSKAEVLELIINNAEGDYSKLSHFLALLAEKLDQL